MSDTYAAGEPNITSRDGIFYENLWRDARPAVVKDAKVNVDRWLELGKTLIPKEAELNHILDVMAFKLQHADVKINHGILHAGNESCGKTIFWKPFIWALCGPHRINAESFDASYWGHHLMSELVFLYGIDDTLVSRIKSILAAPPKYLEVHRLNCEPILATNKMLVLALSNVKKPISLPEHDQNWFAVWSSAPKMDDKTAEQLVNWYMDEGYEAIAVWLYQRDVSTFDPFKMPMTTDFKKSLFLIQTDIENE